MCFVLFQETLGKDSATLVDLFKPLDGKNIEEIEDESSSVFSDPSLKVVHKLFNHLQLPE